MGYEVQDHYFSGQGVVLVGQRDSLGRPLRLLPVGNVSALKLSIATTVIQHKESQSGQRGIDLRLTTEINASLSMTLENYNSVNLGNSLRGDSTSIPAATAATESVIGYLGAVTPLSKIAVANMSLMAGSTPLVAFVNNTTPWDYKPNPDAGSFLLNDGSLIGFSGLSKAVTAVAVGATTALTATHNLSVGSTVYLSGFGGADAGLLNGKTATVTAVTGTTAFSVNINTATKTITATGTPTYTADGQTIAATYDYAAQFLVDSLTEGQPELYMRFEGLNTAEQNQPVVVEVFRFATDPLKELDLIADTVQQFVLDGSVLADALQTSGSKYFRVRKLV